MGATFHTLSPHCAGSQVSSVDEAFAFADTAAPNSALRVIPQVATPCVSVASLSHTLNPLFKFRKSDLVEISLS
jgi:hypothetical protein